MLHTIFTNLLCSYYTDFQAYYTGFIWNLYILFQSGTRTGAHPYKVKVPNIGRFQKTSFERLPQFYLEKQTVENNTKYATFIAEYIGINFIENNYLTTKIFKFKY